MDENTVFQGPQTPVVPPSPPPPASNPTTISGQGAVPDTSPKESVFSFVSFKAIIKVILGIVVVLLFVFFVKQIIIPHLPQSKSEKVTLTYWGLWEDENVMRGVLSDFERQNSNIKVNYIKQDKKQYRERLLARIQNNLGPDVFRFHNTWLPMLSSTLLPLPEDVIKKEDFKKLFYPTTQNDLVKNGAIYGIPLEIDVLSLFVNSDLFRNAAVSVPQTWEDFIVAARRLTVKDENGQIKTAGAALGTFDNITHAPDIISLLFVQNGAKLKNLSETQKSASDALSFYTAFAIGDGKVWDKNQDMSVLTFAKGNLAMYFGYSWDIFTIKAINSNLSFDIYPVPRLQNRTATIASYWVEGVSVKSKHQKEAFMLMQFLAKKETEQKLFSQQTKTRFFGEPYGRSDLADSLKDNKFVYPFIQQGSDAVSSFFASDTFDNGLNSQMNAYLGNAVNSILDNTSAQSAVDTLSSGVSQIFKQYGQ